MDIKGGGWGRVVCSCFYDALKVTSAGQVLLCAFQSWFSYTIRPEVFLLPPGWDASPSQGYPSIKFVGTHLFIWVEQREALVVKVSYSRTQHNGPWSGLEI